MSLRTTIELLDDKLRIVTPLLTPWLESHGDDPYPPWVGNTIRKLLVTPPRIRSGFFSASSAGTCLRAQEFGFLGMAPTPGTREHIPPELMAVFDNGKWGHLRWQARLLSAGILQQIEVSMTWPNMYSVNTLDGMGIVDAEHPNRKWRNEEFGFELKTVSPFLYPRWVSGPPQAKHLAQIHRYFLVSGYRLFVIIYENKGTNAWYEWVIRPDPVLMRQSELELQHLNTAVDRQLFHEPLSSCKIRTGPNWRECPYAGKGGVCETTKRWP